MARRWEKRHAQTMSLEIQWAGQACVRSSNWMMHFTKRFSPAKARDVLKKEG